MLLVLFTSSQIPIEDEKHMAGRARIRCSARQAVVRGKSEKAWKFLLVADEEVRQDLFLVYIK
jgi:hypothetical protein